VKHPARLVAESEMPARLQPLPACRTIVSGTHRIGAQVCRSTVKQPRIHYCGHFNAMDERRGRCAIGETSIRRRCRLRSRRWHIGDVAPSTHSCLSKQLV